VCYAVAAQGPGFAADDLAPSSWEASNPAAAPSGAASQAVHHQQQRYCLLGVDHLLHPRTYFSSSPAAVQRTEILEWAVRTSPPSAVAGGGGGDTPLLLLLPLQPYKLLYAHTLAEFGRVPEAIAYCQVWTDPFSAANLSLSLLGFPARYPPSALASSKSPRAQQHLASDGRAGVVLLVLEGATPPSDPSHRGPLGPTAHRH